MRAARRRILAVALLVVALAAAAGLLAYRSKTRDVVEVETVTVGPDGRALRLYGIVTPERPLIAASADASGDQVRVGLVQKMPFRGSNDGPGIVACAEVRLDEPVGSRRIVDAESGRPLRPGRPPPGQTRASLARVRCERF